MIVRLRPGRIWRHPQFSLRAMFLVITCCALSLGRFVQHVAEQRAAVTAVLAQGGELCYEPDERLAADAWWRQGWLARFQNFVGRDAFRDVVSVELDRRCDDSTLLHVGHFTSLRHIFVYDASRVSDGGIARLAGLRRLTSIGLSHSQLGDDSLRALSNLPRLTDLFIPGVNVSDAGLAYLQGCRELRYLTLGGRAAGVTDIGARSVGALLKLEELDLSGANIGPNGIAYLKRLNNLRCLQLSNNTQLRDDGLISLTTLTGLEELYLRNTNVTSKGVRHLQALHKLRILDLSDNPGVTDAALTCLSGLGKLEELALHGTRIGSRGLAQLERLTKLQKLDLSENEGIAVDALAHLARLAKLEYLDLHNTNVTARSNITPENVAHLLRLTHLAFLDLSGTGAETRCLHGMGVPGWVTGSRASGPYEPGTSEARDYYSAAWEARMIKQGSELQGERASAKSWLTRSRTLERTVRRMLAVIEVAGVTPSFQPLRPTLEATPRRLSALPEKGLRELRRELSDFVATARANADLWRLYTAASDLESADILQGYILHLERVRRKWALTDIERDEYQEAPDFLHACLRDALGQLGLKMESAAPFPPNELRTIWERSRMQCERNPGQTMRQWGQRQWGQVRMALELL